MLVKKYNTKENVQAWQEFLNTQGGTLQVDGKWGPMTAAATRRFQIRARLTPDGIVGENSLSVAVQRGFAGFSGTVEVLKPKATGKTILISAGHTNKLGFDRGVAGNGLIEGQEAVIVRDAVAFKLRELGHTVREDGADGINEPLSKALGLIPGTDLAVEIHFNAFHKPEATGSEVLGLPKVKEKAQAIAKAISDTLGIKLRGDGGFVPDTQGQHSRLAFCRAGGLVVEVCFLTNSSDVAAYKAKREQLYTALAAVISAKVK
jgi:N-acetylmuramoyl-L-alanine amidase